MAQDPLHRHEGVVGSKPRSSLENAIEAAADFRVTLIKRKVLVFLSHISNPCPSHPR